MKESFDYWVSTDKANTSFGVLNLPSTGIDQAKFNNLAYLIHSNDTIYPKLWKRPTNNDPDCGSDNPIGCRKNNGDKLECQDGGPAGDSWYISIRNCVNESMYIGETVIDAREVEGHKEVQENPWGGETFYSHDNVPYNGSLVDPYYPMEIVSGILKPKEDPNNWDKTSEVFRRNA